MKHIPSYWLEIHFNLPRTHKDYLQCCENYAQELTTNNKTAKVVGNCIYLDHEKENK